MDRINTYMDNQFEFDMEFELDLFYTERMKRWLRQMYKKPSIVLQTLKKKSMLDVAMSQYGVKEIVGEKNNKTIVDYSKDIGIDWISDDEVPWCSVFINWAAYKAGYERTGKANARSWLDVGTEVKVPQTGDIVVFRRGNNGWSGHVGIYVNDIDSRVYVLGGNQSNMVNVSSYSKKDLLGYRRLNKI